MAPLLMISSAVEAVGPVIHRAISSALDDQPRSVFQGMKRSTFDIGISALKGMVPDPTLFQMAAEIVSGEGSNDLPTVELVTRPSLEILHGVSEDARLVLQN